MPERTLALTDARVEVRARGAAGVWWRWRLRWSGSWGGGAGAPPPRRGGGAVAPARGQVPAPPSADPWANPLASASAYVNRRHGRVAFALVDQAGVVHGVRLRARFLSASLVKAMLLVAYLNQADVLQRPLAKPERERLASMIQRSDNDAATSVRDMVGNVGLRKVARRAGMLDFAAARSWGSSRITAADQARFFFQLDALVPELHRPFARQLLATIIPSQRWGIPAATPPGWTVFFKGGWRPANSWVVNQAAFLEGPPGRLAIAILSDRNPSFAYGTRTIRGVASRLLTAANA
jgi:hypothetical protein